MKVIVFGGTGWVGHHIVLKLVDAGYDVTVCCRGRKKEYLKDVLHVKTVYADKMDENSMKEILSAGYDAVIDTVPQLKSIEWARKYAVGLKHYIHCSSTGGYAPLPFIPCDETAKYTGFGNTGGWSLKAQVDTAVLDGFMREGFPATVIRPCYITGPGRFPLDNLGDRRPEYVADIKAEKVLDVPDNGLALLQPIHVKDLAGAFVLALQSPRSIGQIYNICLSHAVTLCKYHEITASVFGKKAHLNFLPLEVMLEKYASVISELDMRFMATHMCFSIEKAKQDLGYKPQYTVEEAIEETALWAESMQ